MVEYTRRQFNKMVAVLVAAGATIGISAKSIARRIWKKLRVHPQTVALSASVPAATVLVTGELPVGIYSDSYSVVYG